MGRPVRELLCSDQNLTERCLRCLRKEKTYTKRLLCHGYCFGKYQTHVSLFPVIPNCSSLACSFPSTDAGIFIVSGGAWVLPG